MWKLVSFARRGNLRTRILESLVIPNNPTDLARKLNSHRSTISQVIGSMVEKGLVKRLNPGEKNLSIYGLTVIGRKVVEQIKNEIISFVLFFFYNFQNFGIGCFLKISICCNKVSSYRHCCCVNQAVNRM